MRPWIEDGIASDARPRAVAAASRLAQADAGLQLERDRGRSELPLGLTDAADVRVAR